MRYEAHRGVSNEYPENTLPAFRAALELGYDMIELDPKFTADGRCVILHDRTVGRTGRATDGGRLPDAAIEKLSFDEARSFDFGLWKGERFRGTPIPTLEEALEFALENRIRLKFDNVIETFTDDNFESFLLAVEKSGAGEYAGFTFRRPETVKRLDGRFPDAELHFDGAYDEKVTAEAASLAGNRRFTVWLPFDNRHTAWCKAPKATPELCGRVRRYGEVGVWLLTDGDELETARASLKADIIETDGSLKPSSTDNNI